MLSPQDKYAVADMDKQNLNLVFHNAKYCLSQKYNLDLANFITKQKSFKKDNPNIQTSPTFSGEMIVNRNNVIIAMNSQLIVVNHLEQKCSAIIKICGKYITV